jgi:hypothetical protein
VRLQSGVVRLREIGAVALVGLAVAGCGAKNVRVYHADGSAKCLRDAGYRVRTDAENLGVVAAAAPLGSLRAFEPGNTVTISFGNDHREALNISKLYRKFAPKRLRPHIDDVMEIQKNAVLLWTITPPTEDHDKVTGCLQG